MECEIAAHGAPYCTRSSSKKKKKSSNVTRKPARQGEGRGGLAGAGQAGQERGLRAFTHCQGSGRLGYALQGRTRRASGPRVCDPEFNCKNFFLFFLLVDMMSSKQNNPEKTLDYVVVTQPALSPSLESAFLSLGLGFFLVFCFSCPLIPNSTPHTHTHFNAFNLVCAVGSISWGDTLNFGISNPLRWSTGPSSPRYSPGGRRETSLGHGGGAQL